MRDDDELDEFQTTVFRANERYREAEARMAPGAYCWFFGIIGIAVTTACCVIGALEFFEWLLK